MKHATELTENSVAQSASVKLFPSYVIHDDIVVITLKAKNGFRHRLKIPIAALDFLKQHWPFEVVGHGAARKKIVRDGADLSKVYADLQGIEVTKTAGLDWTGLVAPVIRKPACWVTRFDIIAIFAEAAKVPARSTPMRQSL